MHSRAVGLEIGVTHVHAVGFFFFLDFYKGVFLFHLLGFNIKS
jgi:hypothetical protein